jgi:hypothetical protein
MHARFFNNGDSKLFLKPVSGPAVSGTSLGDRQRLCEIGSHWVHSGRVKGGLWPAIRYLSPVRPRGSTDALNRRKAPEVSGKHHSVCDLPK